MAEGSTAPIDRRLLKRAAPVCRLFVQGAVLSAVQAAMILLFSWQTAMIIAGLVAGDALSEHTQNLLLLAGAVAVRFACSWLSEYTAHSAASRVKTQLRAELTTAFAALGPVRLAAKQSGHLVTVAGRGLDALDAYFSKFLPQLISTAIVTPVLIAVLFVYDLFTGIVVVVALPLIPVFMALIGWATESVQKKQWQSLTVLSAGFVELIDGLSTLKIFGREHRQTERLSGLTEEYRVRTMKVLRVSFLSSFVLELAASLSVALVAVAIGIRLLDGSIGLGIALFLLIVTPEVFLPVRQVGTQFHASAEGVAAVSDAFDVIDSATVDAGDAGGEVQGATAVADSGGGVPGRVQLSGLTAAYDDRTVLNSIDVTVDPGEIVVITGESGSGKSTLAAVLLGFLQPVEGQALFGSSPMTAEQVSWSPQQPKLLAGSVQQNIAAGAEAEPELLAEAAALAALPEELLQARLGEHGDGLSGGQAARVSLARSYYRALRLRQQAGAAPLLVLDEPTASLDDDTEQRVLEGIRSAASAGFPVLVFSHRTAILDLGVRHLLLAGGKLTEMLPDATVQRGDSR